MKFLLSCLLFLTISAHATQIYVEVRESSADITTEVGESLFGSYLYALVSASSVHTELFFNGNEQEAIELFSDIVEKDSSVYLDSIKYVAEGDYILALLVDNYGYGYYSVAILRR